mgnify:CR=1 FL=1
MAGALAQHRIPLLYELAVRELEEDSYKVPGRLNQVLTMLVLIAGSVALYLVVPESKQIQWCIASILVLNVYVSNKLSGFAKQANASLVYLVKLRNQLLLNHNYIPPLYRARPASKEELAVWKKSMDEIDRDVLLGMAPNMAANEAIKRTLEYVDRCVIEDGKLVSKPPSNRAGVVMDGS